MSPYTIDGKRIYTLRLTQDEIDLIQITLGMEGSEDADELSLDITRQTDDDPKES